MIDPRDLDAAVARLNNLRGWPWMRILEPQDALAIILVCDALAEARQLQARYKQERDEARAETLKWRRIRTPRHGRCCTCQHCGQEYDDCRCDLDEVSDDYTRERDRAACAETSRYEAWERVAGQVQEITTLRAELTEAREQLVAQTQEIVRLKAAKAED